jgi:hypothetical protein
MSLLNPNPDERVTEPLELPNKLKIPSGRLTATWRTWFAKLYYVVSPLGDNGTTLERPTQDLYVGRGYLDLTLGKPIWVQSLNPTVWIDAQGTAV